MISKITSFVLAIMIFFQTLLPASLGAKNEVTFNDEDLSALTSVADYINYVQEHGAPSMDTGTFVKALSPITLARRILSGKIFSPVEESFIDVTLDDHLTRLCDYLLENTGLDINVFLNHMPNFGTSLGDALSDVISIDTTEMRQRIFAAGDKCRADGFTALSSVIYIFAMFFAVAEKIDIYTVPSEAVSGDLTVLMDVYYRDGTMDTIDPDIDVNVATGHAYNSEGTGLSGTGYEVDIYDLTVYTIVNSWQRKFGFGLSYDLFADRNPAFIYVTRRYKFSYAGKDWMIQLWKGNYALITNGGEMGVYNREKDSVIKTFYLTVEDSEMLDFSMDIYHGDELLVSRGPETTWWLTAFKMGKAIYLPDTLTMDFSISFPDEEMLEAFTSAVDSETARDVTYTVDGLTVNGIW